MQWGTETYRRGALERLDDARLLKDSRKYALSIYVGGLAVEGMLRALHWLKNRAFDERHDLKRIAVRVESLGLLREGERDRDLVNSVQGVARRWTNAMRFADYDQLERFLSDLGELRRREEGEVRRVCREHFDRCSEIIRRCETLLRRYGG
jgi:HEPN domain-containing protein